MIVIKGIVEDWYVFKLFYYKIDGKFFVLIYYCCEFDDCLVGVVVMVYLKLLLVFCYCMFFKLKLIINIIVVNQYWGWYVNNNFVVISCLVVDIQYCGVGVFYRMINLVSRMYDWLIIEIQFLMSKYNFFVMKVGFKFICFE